MNLSVWKHHLVMIKVFSTLAFLILSLHLSAQESETQMRRMNNGKTVVSTYQIDVSFKIEG